MKRILTFGLVATLFSACGSLRIKAYQPYQSPAKAKKMAAVAFYSRINPLPETPVGGAEPFAKKVQKLESDLIELMQAETNKMYYAFGSGLEAQFGLPSIYAKGLESASRYERALQKAENEVLKYGKSPFDRIFLGEGGFNPFEFEEGELKEYLEESPRVKSAVRGLLKNLDSEVLAVGFTRLDISKVSRLGERASALMQVDYYFFDEQGKLIGHGYGETEPVEVTGDDLGQFRSLLQDYPALQNLVFTELTKVEE